MSTSPYKWSAWEATMSGGLSLWSDSMTLYVEYNGTTAYAAPGPNPYCAPNSVVYEVTTKGCSDWMNSGDVWGWDAFQVSVPGPVPGVDSYHIELAITPQNTVAYYYAGS